MDDSYEFKSWKQWPHRIVELLKGARSRFVTVSSVVNTDGVASPLNQMVLVKKEKFAANQTSATAVNILGMQIDQWLQVPLASLKDYMLQVYVRLDGSSGMAETDEYTIYLSGAGTDDILYQTDIATPGAAWRDYWTFWPSATSYNLLADDASWAAGTSTFLVTVLAYRLPSGICVN